MLRYDGQVKTGLVASYGIRPGNGAGLFLQPWSPHGPMSWKIAVECVLLLYVCSAVEGAGIQLIGLICLALSVLSRLLELSPEGATLSPIATSLSARPAAGRNESHLVTAVAHYIYHRHNPQLPTLATKLLRTLSIVSHCHCHPLLHCTLVKLWHSVL